MRSISSLACLAVFLTLSAISSIAGPTFSPEGRWVLAKAEPALPHDPPNSTEIVIDIQGDEINGHAGCNGFSATTDVDEHNFSITGLTATAQVCNDHRDEIEHAFLGLLGSTKTVHQSKAGRLVLEGEGRLEFRRD